MIVARLLTVIIALCVAVQVVRSAVVHKLAQTDPATASALWPDHPTLEISRALVGIGEAMRDRRPVGPGIFQLMRDAATKAPLEPDPYLVRGVQAQLAGDSDLAERAFRAAQRRDPRSLPAAYFLASHYVQRGDADKGLVQIANLARLAPGGEKSAAPYVAAYARDRANWRRLRALFRAEPKLRDQSLEVLAADPANADIVLGVTDPSARTSDQPWIGTLLWSLVRAGEYRKAYAVWAQVSGLPARPAALINDPGFTETGPPPPFNWQLTSSKVGFAERKPGGRLHVIFYGQDDGTLARQLLLLPPGAYRMTLRLAGDPQDEALGWVLICDKPLRELSRVPLDRMAAGGWTFEVPAGCQAQWLELRGTSEEMPRQSVASISNLKLNRGGGRG